MHKYKIFGYPMNKFMSYKNLWQVLVIYFVLNCKCYTVRHMPNPSTFYQGSACLHTISDEIPIAYIVLMITKKNQNQNKNYKHELPF